MDNHPVVRETIHKMTLFLRGEKVLLDRDIAQLYGVETKVLNQTVQRNISKFPQKYMFQLNSEEFENWRSQFVTSNSVRMGLRYAPYAFTKRGIVMLATILRSERAVSMAFEIVEVFIAADEFLATHKQLAEKIRQIEQKLGIHSEIIKDILAQIRRMIDKPKSGPKQIGFRKE